MAVCRLGAGQILRNRDSYCDTVPFVIDAAGGRVLAAGPAEPDCCPTEVAINGRIYVDLSSVASAEAEYQQVLDALRNQLDQLDAELRTSLREWTGEAQAAYQAAHAQWRAAADDVARSLVRQPPFGL